MNPLFKRAGLAYYGSADRPNFLYDDYGFPVLADDGSNIEID